MSRLNRRDHGQPIREAMRNSGLSIQGVADATRTVDPAGHGVSRSAVGVLVAQGPSARDRCRIRTAWLIADALDQPLQNLFNMP